MSRRVVVVTGTRAEYGLLRPVIVAARNRKDLDLKVVATGMHLDERAGRTVQQVHAEFGVDARVPMHPSTDSLADHARAIGHGVLGMVDTFEALDPDIVLVLGDRPEVLAAAIAATYSGRVVAHIHGGDISGGFDETTRHAVTKLAHLHFVASRQSRDRVLRLGEDPSDVHLVGAPGIDDVVLMGSTGQTALRRPPGLPDGPYLLFLMHPVSTRPQTAAADLDATLQGALRTGLHVVAIRGNLDPGGPAARAALDAYEDRLIIETNVPRDRYLALLKHSASLVGNSSSGIIEAPALGVPAVNVGDRQVGRERAENVLDVPPDRAAVEAAVRRAISPSFRKRLQSCTSPYGDGHASERIARILATARLEGLLEKMLRTDAAPDGL